MYIPAHAGPAKVDVEFGVVSSMNERYIFVKFDAEVKKLGLAGATAKACIPKQIKKVPAYFK